MAKIGLNNFRVAVATVGATGAITYANCQKPGKAVSFKCTPTIASAELYADDSVAEKDTRVVGGKVNLEIDRRDKVLETILGHSVSTKGEITDNVNDVVPYVGVGRVIVEVVDGKRVYHGSVLSLVKFSEPEEENKTVGEKLEYKTTSLEGDLLIPQDGIWRKRQTFDTQLEAIKYIEKALGKTE